jgi:hypothetical protein
MASKNDKPITYHQRLVNALADGKWQSFRSLYQRVARFIDPTVADTEYRRRHPKWKEEKEAVRVAAGRKRLVFLSLNSMHHHRDMVEVRGGKDWEREYKLTPAALRARRGAKSNGPTKRVKGRYPPK